MQRNNIDKSSDKVLNMHAENTRILTLNYFWQYRQRLLRSTHMQDGDLHVEDGDAHISSKGQTLT